MTLNDLERRNSSYFAFFPLNSTDFQADYITLVEDRRIMSVKYSPSSSLLLLAKTITHPAGRSLCDSWASCFLDSLRSWRSEIGPAFSGTAFSTPASLVLHFPGLHFAVSIFRSYIFLPWKFGPSCRSVFDLFGLICPSFSGPVFSVDPNKI